MRCFMHYILIVAIVFAIFGLAHGAPKMRRLRRHKHWSDDPEYPHYPTKLMWNQSCGNDLSFTWKLGTSIRVPKPLKPLRDEIKGCINRLGLPSMQAIDTSDVSQWFSEPFNSSYGFLYQVNSTSSHIYLRKRHIETQVYVGAFQYLLWKQRKHDSLRNEGNSKSIELGQLLTLAKNLLCEIESAIHRIAKRMPAILSRDAMEQRMTFRNNNQERKTHDEVDDIDSKFAKVRFSEYLHGLQQVLRNRRRKPRINTQKLIPIHPVIDGQSEQNGIVAMPTTAQTKFIDQTLFDDVLRDNDAGIKKSKPNKKNGGGGGSGGGGGQKKHRNRMRDMDTGKQRKHNNKQRKNPKRLESHPNDLNQFKSHRRRNNARQITPPSTVLLSSTTTTTAPTTLTATNA